MVAAGAAAQPLTVSAASSVAEAMSEAGRAWAAAGGPGIQVNAGGSNVLARQIAGFPPVAIASDRQSAYESFDRDQASAVRREMELSLAARRQESQKGAARFAGGEGRHGKFERK